MAITSSRVDVASKHQPNCTPGAEKCSAIARGLTVDEAQELALWLKEAGFASVEVVEETDQCSVVWAK